MIDLYMVASEAKHTYIINVECDTCLKCKLAQSTT